MILRNGVLHFLAVNQHNFNFSTALLHLVLISGTMKANINCFSKGKVLEQKILQDDAKKDVAIMWVPTILNGNFNHVVPLIEPLHNSLLPRDSDTHFISFHYCHTCSSLTNHI